MLREKLFEANGYILAAASFFFSLILFYNDTGMFLGSFAAALMAAGLFWGTYLIMRFVYLVFKS